MTRNLENRLIRLETRRRARKFVPRRKSEKWTDYIARVGVETAKNRIPPYNPGWKWCWQAMDFIEGGGRGQTRDEPIYI